MTNLHDKLLPSVSAFEDYKLSQDPERDVSWRWEDTRNAAGVWEVQSAHLLEVIPGAAGTTAYAQGSQQTDRKRLLTNMQRTT